VAIEGLTTLVIVNFAVGKFSQKNMSIKHTKLCNTLNTSMHTFTSDYKRREHNGESHSNLNSVLARCTVDQQLTPDYYELREFAIMMTRRKSEAEIPTASPLRSWPHIHTVALLQQLLPIGCHKRGSHARIIQSPTQ